jgi:hypothetical protein
MEINSAKTTIIRTNSVMNNFSSSFDFIYNVRRKNRNNKITVLEISLKIVKYSLLENRKAMMRKTARIIANLKFRKNSLKVEKNCRL